MARKIVIGIGTLGLLCAAGVVGVQVYRGPIGETDALGGELSSTVVPEFPSLDPSRWCNGEPTSIEKSRGEVVFLEGWSPT